MPTSKRQRSEHCKIVGTHMADFDVMCDSEKTHDKKAFEQSKDASCCEIVLQTQQITTVLKVSQKIPGTEDLNTYTVTLSWDGDEI
eukprot:1108024-Rhodomonas_salina.1